MNRGDRREPIFRDDLDRERFVQTLEEACDKAAWQVHAYVLMPNHFHLVLETPQPNLVAGMKWLLGTYTNRFNRRHRVCGHLFAGRYKSLIVDGSASGYLKTVCDYVHLNPSRAKLLTPDQPLKHYRWSSWPTYLGSPSRRPGWLRVDRLLGEYRIPKDSTAGRQQLERALETRREAEKDGEFRAVRRGWCLGEPTFRQELLAQVSERLGAEHYGQERAESELAKAERIIAEEARHRKGASEDWQARPKGGGREGGSGGPTAGRNHDDPGVDR
ncbi:MAG: transposase [Verrucomicrobia bacterium]|nr:transposase [Verrucomicrobiota bacterium]